MHAFRTLAAPSLLLIAFLAPSAASADDAPPAKEKPAASKPAAKVPASKTPADKIPGDGTLSVEQLAQRAKPSVVVISTAGRDGRQHGLGTGFVVSADGLIATNQHVIGEARPVTVQLADGRKFEVTEIHAADRALDLAVLRIAEKNLPALELADSKRVQEGEAIVAIGNPHGLKHSVVSGVVSGKREIENRAMLQLAMPIEPGNSGGPVLDARGRVVGVVTMKSAVTNNLGFAVESNLLKPLLEKPNPIPMSRWLTIGAIDRKDWLPLFGARWQQRAGRILVSGAGDGFGGRSLCLSQSAPPASPFELAVQVKLDDEAGAAGLVFHADGDDRHYGFYPSNGKLRLSCFEGPTVYQWRVLQETPSSHYRPGQWNSLKVRVEKERLLCYVNEHLVIESPDVTYQVGKIGLAKFRETSAEFKTFRVGAKLEAPASDRQAADWLAEIDSLPSLDSLRVEQVRPFAERGAAGVASLRRRAESLEKKAADLRRIATDARIQQVARSLRSLVEGKEDRFDLLRGALLVAQLDDEELEADGYVREVDRMAEEIRASLPPKADEQKKLAALAKYMFADNGFHGSRFDYYHRANSHINRVIDDREGLPITLSVLYMELARRLELKVVGVGLPGHFVVRHVAQDGAEQLIDVFEGGRPMSREEADKKVRENVSRPLRDQDLAAASPREILLRMLNNLAGLARDAEDKESLLGYYQASLAIDPELVQERGFVALLRFETGRRDAAIADLDWFLEKKPEGIDLEKIEQMQEYFRSKK